MDANNENFVEMQSEAMEKLNQIEYALESKAGAAYALGMEGMGKTLYLLQARLMDAIDLLKKANTVSFNTYMRATNQNSKNILAAVLATNLAVGEATEGEEK